MPKRRDDEMAVWLCRRVSPTHSPPRLVCLALPARRSKAAPLARRHMGPASMPVKRRGRRRSPPPSRVGPPPPSPVLSLPLLDPPGSPPGHVSPPQKPNMPPPTKRPAVLLLCCCCCRAGAGRGGGGAAVVALAQGRKPFFFIHPMQVTCWGKTSACTHAPAPLS